MNKYTQILYQYRLAVRELKEFEVSDAFYNMKGYLQVKKEKRTYKSTEYFYTNVYYIRVDYINGEPNRMIKYIKKAEIEEYKQKQAEKKENRQKYKELRKKVKRLRKQVKMYVKGNEEVFKEVENHWENYTEFREDEKGVVSILGEKQRSRVECIVANIAFAFQMPYLYEPVIKLYNTVLHPDFSFLVNGQKILLEVLGKYEDREYRNKWEEKKKVYRKNGYAIGKNMVCIACTNPQDIDSQKIGKVLFELAKGILPKEIAFV